jgi:hypothetical protein
VKKIYGDFGDWCILLFDNALLLATDYQDVYAKLKMFIDRSIQFNVKLKFSKTWLGFTEVKFFGYMCRHKSYGLTEDRKKAILKIPFPHSGIKIKKVRIMLGCGVFFSPFIKTYSDLVSHIPDMTLVWGPGVEEGVCVGTPGPPTKTTFNETMWKHVYRALWENFKLGLQQSCELFHPDYSLEWILRSDASDFGVGGMLIQLYVKEDPMKCWHRNYAKLSSSRMTLLRCWLDLLGS